MGRRYHKANNKPAALFGGPDQRRTGPRLRLYLSRERVAYDPKGVVYSLHQAEELIRAGLAYTTDAGLLQAIAAI